MSVTPASPPPPLPEELRLVEILATGVTDEVAASRLDWTPRTLRRRLRSTMDKLGAVSRFQAGVLAVQVGWLDRRADAFFDHPSVQTHKGGPGGTDESL